VSIVNEVSDLFKKIKDVAKFAKDQAIMSLLVDLQEKFIELREENSELKQVISAFSHTKDVEKRITRTNGNVADYTDENGKLLKICSVCWDRDKKIVQVEPNYTNHYNCAICGKIYFFGDKEINEDYSTEHNRNSIDY
jgi:hypothetical protein